MRCQTFTSEVSPLSLVKIMTRKFFLTNKTAHTQMYKTI